MTALHRGGQAEAGRVRSAAWSPRADPHRSPQRACSPLMHCTWANPRIAFSGVRSSRHIRDRRSDLVRFARSAWSLAASSSAVRVTDAAFQVGVQRRDLLEQRVECACEHADLVKRFHRHPCMHRRALEHASNPRRHVVQGLEQASGVQPRQRQYRERADRHRAEVRCRLMDGRMELVQRQHRTDQHPVLSSRFAEDSAGTPHKLTDSAAPPHPSGRGRRPGLALVRAPASSRGRCRDGQ